MISPNASVILALLLNLKTPFLAPIVYLLSYLRRDLFLISFLFYSLLLSYEFFVEQFYFEIPAFTLLLATFLLLEEGLRIKEKGSAQYLLSISTLIGFFILEALFLILIISICFYIYQDRPKKGTIALIFPIFLVSLFIFFGEYITFHGSTTTQVVLIASITAFATLIWIRKI